MRLLLIQHVTDESSAAPEFRYLTSWVAEEVRSTGTTTRILHSDAVRAADLEDAEAVLLLADPRVLLGRASVGALREALEIPGTEVAYPAPLSEFLDQADRPLYTLRGFEVLEARVLASVGSGSALVSEAEIPPVSLWRAAAVRDLAKGAGGFFGHQALARAMRHAFAGGVARRAGVYHQFIDYYGVVRSDILPHVRAGVREALEIGCGRGLTGKFLKDSLGCRVTGVELNPVVAQSARENLDAVVSGDVMTVAIPGRYDLIVACELFEHLVEQEAFLGRMRELLAPGGTILLSVPNVGHWSVVEDLLAGRWDYLPIGLLCYTHFRFFTRHTLENWVRRSGYSDVELVPQRTEVPESFLELAAGRGFAVDLESLGTKGFYVLIR